MQAQRKGLISRPMNSKIGTRNHHRLDALGGFDRGEPIDIKTKPNMDEPFDAKGEYISDNHFNN